MADIVPIKHCSRKDIVPIESGICAVEHVISTLSINSSPNIEGQNVTTLEGKSTLPVVRLPDFILNSPRKSAPVARRTLHGVPALANKRNGLNIRATKLKKYIL